MVKNKTCLSSCGLLIWDGGIKQKEMSELFFTMFSLFSSIPSSAGDRLIEPVKISRSIYLIK